MWYDLIVLVILVYTGLRGAARGLVWQLAWIAALVLCFWFAESFSLTLAPYIKVEPPLNRWIAMFVLYMGFSFLSFGVARMLRGMIERAKFTEYDRHLGGLFGLVKGVVFSLVLTFFVITLSKTARSTVLNSYSGHAAAQLMEQLRPVMPAELHQVLAPYIDRLQPGEGEGQERGPLMDLGPGDTLNADWDDQPFDVIGTDDQPIADGTQQSISLEDILHQLPIGLGRELREAAMHALQSTTGAERDRVTRELQSGVPGRIRSTLARWISPVSPNPFEDPTANAPLTPASGQGSLADRAERNRLLEEISAIYSDSPAGQQRIIDDAGDRLNGIPDTVALAAVKDWYADLLSLEDDPDPLTSYSSDLDVRIVRQLAAAGIPVTRLSSELQRRLRNASQL